MSETYCPDHVTKRELITAAQEALCPKAKGEIKWGIRYAIAKIAKEIRDAHLEEVESPKREELRDKLVQAGELARQLHVLLGQEDVTRASVFGWASRDEDEDDARTFHALEKVGAIFDQLPELLHSLGIATPAIIEKLGLSGRIGAVGPWWKFRLPPEALLAVFGLRLHEAAISPTKKLGPRNPALQAFLSLTWQAATGENTEDKDWAHAIRVARIKPGRTKDGSEVAQINAVLRAQKIIRETSRAAGGRGSPK